MQVRRTVRDLRRHNRSVLLSSLYLGEPQSRQDLGRSSGLSQGTVSNVVGELIDEGLVVEAGLVDSDGGRPRTLLRVNPGYTHVVGVDVGETGTRVEVFDLAMRPLATSYHPLPSARPDPAAVVAADPRGAGRGPAGGRGRPDERARASASACSARSSRAREAIVHAQTIGWDSVPLERMLRAGTALPICLENGAKTLGQAELWFGAGRGVQHAVITLIGSGVGAAVICNGAISRGVTQQRRRVGSHLPGLRRPGLPVRVARLPGGVRGGRGDPGPLAGGPGRADGAGHGRAVLAGRCCWPTAARWPSGCSPRPPATSGPGWPTWSTCSTRSGSCSAGWAGHALGRPLLPEIRAAARERALRHAVRPDEHPARAARAGRGRTRRGDAAGRRPARPRGGPRRPPARLLDAPA